MNEREKRLFIFVHLLKDNVLTDFYGRWTIKSKCDSVTLESSHPWRPPASKLSSYVDEKLFYTYECKSNEIAYFKVDMNLIGGLDDSFLGSVLENNNYTLTKKLHGIDIYSKQWKVFLGMIENEVENYKVIGIRDMNMNADLKTLFNRIDPLEIIRKPYFNDAKETFRILSEIHFKLTVNCSSVTLNGDKFDWETMNTRKIKVIFNAASLYGSSLNDYGTRIQIKCYQKIDRISQTLDAEQCVNWEFMDSFGVRIERRTISEDSYQESVSKFYDSVNWRGIGRRLTMKSKDLLNIRSVKIDVRHE